MTAAKAPPTDSQQPSSNQLSTWPWFERTVIEVPVEDAKGTGRSDAVLRGPFANLVLNYNPFMRLDFRGPERNAKIGLRPFGSICNAGCVSRLYCSPRVVPVESTKRCLEASAPLKAGSTDAMVLRRCGPSP